MSISDTFPLYNSLKSCSDVTDGLYLCSWIEGRLVHKNKQRRINKSIQSFIPKFLWLLCPPLYTIFDTTCKCYKRNIFLAQIHYFEL